MSVILKKKYSNSLKPQFTEDYQVLIDFVKAFQGALKIKQPTVVYLKKKVDMWGLVCGTTFFNPALNKISCHVYVHRHSTVLGTLIFIAHEMVHAWQIDSKKKVCEQQAEDLSLAFVASFHLERFPDKEESLMIAEVYTAREFIH